MFELATSAPTRVLKQVGQKQMMKILRLGQKVAGEIHQEGEERRNS